MPATSAGLKRLSFFFFLFLLQPLTVLIKQTRQAVRAIKQSILLKMSMAVPGEHAAAERVSADGFLPVKLGPALAPDGGSA